MNKVLIPETSVVSDDAAIVNVADDIAPFTSSLLCGSVTPIPKLPPC